MCKWAGLLTLLAAACTGLQVEQLTQHQADDRHPSWRSEGGAIVFESNRDGPWNLYVLDASTGAVRPAVRSPSNDRYPAWDPSGRRLAFCSDRDGSPGLYVADLDSGRTRRLETPAGEVLFPAWSPRGDRIAFSLAGEEGIALYVMAAGGESPARRLVSGGSREVWPSWSPDGSELAFFSRQATGGAEDDLFTLNLETGETQRLTTAAGHDFCPDWSPRAGRIAFAYSRPADVRGIALLTLSSGRVRELVDGYHRITEPAFSPDGRQLVFAGRKTEGEQYDLYRVHLPH